MRHKLRVSIVCPAYNEAEGLAHFHAALTHVLADLEAVYEFEILYIDDGSRDGTLEQLRDLARDDERVRYFSLSRNFGQQAALAAGLEHATGQAVITMDSDGQHPPEVIPGLLQRWRDGYDHVATRREDDPTLGWFKRWSSGLFYRLFNAVSPVPMVPGGADFRLLSRRVLDALLRCRETPRVLRGLVGWLGFRSVVVPFQAAPRTHGTTKYSWGSMFGLASDSLVSFSRLPLRLAFFLGTVFLLALPLLLCGGVLHASLGGAPAWGTLALLGFIASMNGTVLLALGILGEYVGRIADQVKGRPLYLLKESSDAAPLGVPEYHYHEVP